MQTDSSNLTPETKALLAKALKEYGSTVFWNMKPSETLDGVASASRALRKRGDLAASRLAAQMMRSLNHAP
ncbi:hypothetical protein KUV57_11145 [Epibacterium sp. DP7N7-1]|nr:hypothetical protein [Epibacterium sp. DP7N7-1]